MLRAVIGLTEPDSPACRRATDASYSTYKWFTIATAPRGVCEHRQFDNNHVGFVSTDLLDNYMYNIVYRISLFILVQYVLPTLALVYLNARVIVALRRSDTYRSSATRRHPPPPPTPVTSHPPDVVTSSSQSTRSITVVVAVIVTICIVVHVVALTAHVVATVQVRITSSYCVQFVDFYYTFLAHTPLWAVQIVELASL